MLRTARVFISSTFRDMHAERDILTRVVFPQLRRRCLPLGIDVVDVDLRWGVPEAEAESGHALQVCLDEINHSRPFFIGFLGERYGWIPPGEQHSITAREIFFGVLEAPEKPDWVKSRSFFYFRSPDVISSLPEDLRSQFSSESRESAAKVSDLKHRIRAHFQDMPGHVHENYLCRYEGIDLDTSLLGPEEASVIEDHITQIGERGIIPRTVVEELPQHVQAILYKAGVPYVSGLEILADLVLEDIWQAIQSEYQTAIQLTPEAQERQLHHTYGAILRRNFVGRSSQIADLLELARSSGWVVVRGDSGSGKTALLAMAAQELRQAGFLVIERYVGVGPNSLTLAEHRDAIRAELEENELIPPLKTPDFAVGHRGDRALRNALEAMPASTPVSLVLDGIDQLHDFSGLVEWLNFQSAWPQNFTVIMSGAGSAKQLLVPGAVLELGPILPSEQESLLTDFLATYRKTLSSEQIQTILGKKDAHKPLFLRTCAEELRLYQHYDTLSQKIRQIPETIETLFPYVLERIERETDPDLVKTAMRAIACSRGGIPESELLEYLSVRETTPALHWAVVHRQLDPYLKEMGNDARGLLDFSHLQFAEAVRKRYLTSEKAVERVHLNLGMFYESISRSASDDQENPWTNGRPRGFSEAVWHYNRGGRDGYIHALILLTDFSYWMARLALGQLESLVRDLMDLQVCLPELPEEDSDVQKFVRITRVWAAFVSEHLHLLRRAGPSWGPERVFLQLAVEHGDNSPITHQAERWIRSNMEHTLWIRQGSRPQQFKTSPVIAVLEGHTKRVNGLLQQDDGRLISWSVDGTIRFWSPSGRVELIIKGPNRVVCHVARTTDNEILVLYGRRLDVDPGFAVGMKCLERYSTSGAFLGRYASHPKEITGFHVRHDGTTVTWDDDGLVQQWAANGEQLGALADYDASESDLVGMKKEFSDIAIETLQLIHHDEIHKYGEITTVVSLKKIPSSERPSRRDDDQPNFASLHRTGEILLWNILLNPSLPVDEALQDGSPSQSTTTTPPRVEELFDVINDAYGIEVDTESYLLCRNGDVVVWSNGLANRSENKLFRHTAATNTIQVFEGHTDNIWGALEFSDGRILSWSDDRILRLWEPDGKAITALHGMEEPANKALVTNSEKILAWSNGEWPSTGDPFLYCWSNDGNAPARIGEHDGAVEGATEHTDGTIVSWTRSTVYQWTDSGDPLACFPKETCRHHAPEIWERYARAITSGGAISTSRIIVSGHTPDHGHEFDLEWYSKAPVGLSEIPATDAVHLKDQRQLVLYRGAQPISIQSLEAHVTVAPVDWDAGDDDTQAVAEYEAPFTDAQCAAWEAESPGEILSALGDTLPEKHLSREGRTLLHFAAERNPNSGIIEFLLESKLDVNARDAHGTTPLALAAQFNREENVIRELLRWGADVTAADNDGDTVLHAAVFGANTPTVIELLLKHGVPIESVDNFGKQAIDYVSDHPEAETVRHLIQRYQRP